jgi:hypothetical protein
MKDMTMLNWKFLFINVVRRLCFVWPAMNAPFEIRPAKRGTRGRAINQPTGNDTYFRAQVKGIFA